MEDHSGDSPKTLCQKHTGSVTFPNFMLLIPRTFLQPMYQPTNTFNKIQFTGIKLLGVSAMMYHPRFPDGGPPSVETCWSLIFITNCILLSTLVGWCTDCHISFSWIQVQEVVYTPPSRLTFSPNLTHIFGGLVNQFTCCWFPVFMT